MFWRSLMVEGSFSLTNYLDMLSGRRLVLLKNTFLIAVMAAIVSALIGIPLAVLLSRSDLPLRGFLSTMAFLPIVLPPYMIAMSWVIAFGDGGLLGWMMPEGMEIYNIYGVGAVLALSYFPFVFLLTQAGLAHIDPGQEEAALLHMNHWRVLKNITLSSSTPMILAGALIVFILALGNYDVPALMAVNVFSIEIFSQFSAFYNDGKATALAAPLVGISIIAILLIRRFLFMKRFDGRVARKQKPLLVFGRWKWLIFSGMVLFLAGVVLFPLGMMIYQSTSLEFYRGAILTAGQEILNSLMIAAFAGLLLSVLAFLIGYFSLYGRRFVRWSLDLSYLLPLAIPATILGIAYIKMLNRPGLSQILYSSIAIIVLIHIARSLPIVSLVMRSYLKKIPVSHEEVAWTCGVSWWRSLLFIVCPQAMRGMLNAFILGCILSLGELSATILVYPPGKTTIPIRMFTIWHYGQEEIVAAISVMMTGVILILMVCYYLITLRPLDIVEGYHD
ncbi:ABC transporter permease [Planctomycetota bacterium]